MNIKKFIILAALLPVLVLSACNTIPADALKMSSETLQERQLQTRKFTTTNEKKLLSASAQVLQDMGFTIDESETSLGVITASKSASAVNAGQVAGMILIAALGGGATPIDKEQKIRVSSVTSKSGGSTKLRVTFQRMVWDTYGNVSRVEFIKDPEIYQDFFEKLSKSVFLEAHEL